MDRSLQGPQAAGGSGQEREARKVVGKGRVNGGLALTGKKFLEETSRMEMTKELDANPSPASGNTSHLWLHPPPLWNGDNMPTPQPHPHRVALRMSQALCMRMFS